MDFVTFFKDALVGAVPLIFVILGLVEWFKAFKNADGTQKFTGNQLLVISMIVGMVLGVAYMVFAHRPPDTSDWWVVFVYAFSAVIYGLACGLVASGLYNLVKDLISKTLLKIVEQVTKPQPDTVDVVGKLRQEYSNPSLLNATTQKPQLKE